MAGDAELQAVLDAIGVLLQAAKAQPGAPLVALGAALAEVKRPPTPRADSAPLRKPACRHLGRVWTLAADGPPPVASLARALRALEPRLAWIQNPNYTVEALGAHYIDNYAYADVLGPRGLVHSDRAAMGVLLLGPGLHYPDHAHEAEEVYLVVAGDSLWRRGAEPWQAKPPGSLIHHPPWTRHATKSGSEPLLAFYLWVGALNSPAQLVG